MIFLIEIDYYNPKGGMQETLHLTTAQSFSLDGKVYLPVLLVGLDYEESLFSRGTTGGDSSSSIGNIVIPNSSGRFDYLADCGFDGRSFRSYWVDPDAPSVLNQYVSGMVSYAEFDSNDVTLHVSDVTEKLSYKMLRNTFAGTNSGLGAAGGLEGGEDDIKGQNKPMLYGRCRNVQPFLVNAFHLIYAFNYDKHGNRKAIHSVWNVYGKGAEMLYEGDEANGDDLLTASVSAGYYRTCLSEGLIRLGTVPDGDVTCDVMESFGEDSSAGNVIERILSEFPDVEYDTASLNSLKASVKCPVGIFVTGEQTVLEVIREILASVDSWAVPGPDSVLSFGRVPISFSSSKYKIEKDWVTRRSFERLPTQDNAKNIPSRSVKIKHTKNWKVLDAGSLIDAISPERAQFFATEYREAVVSSPSVSSIHPNSQDLEIETLLQSPMPAKLRNGNFKEAFSVTAPLDWYLEAAGTGTAIPDTALGVCVIDAIDSLDTFISQDLTSPDEIYAGEYVLTFFVNSWTPEVVIEDLSEGVVYDDSPLVGADGKVEVTFVTTGSCKISIGTSTGTLEIRDVSLRESNRFGIPEDEAGRRLSLHSVKGERYTFKADYRLCLNFKLGDQIDFFYDRFSLEEGKTFILIGRSLSLPSIEVELDIWRPGNAS